MSEKIYFNMCSAIAEQSVRNPQIIMISFERLNKTGEKNNFAKNSSSDDEIAKHRALLGPLKQNHLLKTPEKLFEGKGNGVKHLLARDGIIY